MTTRRPAILLVLLLALGACTVPSNSPEGYDDLTELNFLTACLGGFGFDVEGVADFETEELFAPEGSEGALAYCRCVYDGASQPVADENGDVVLDANGLPQTFIPFEDFDDVTSALEDDLPLEEDQDSIADLVADDVRAFADRLDELTETCGGGPAVPEDGDEAAESVEGDEAEPVEGDETESVE